MSGHSKWSTIKRQKGITDQKRGAIFTKLGNQLASAARTGTDPSTNSSLALMIEKAKAANMPSANIDRAIQRVADKSAAIMQDVMYEGYGPGGVGILIECTTDNINRTYPEVKHAFTKNGGSTAEKGSVAFQFTRRGMIRVAGVGDDVMMSVLEAGAEDAVEEDGETIVYTEPKSLAEVRTALRNSGLKVLDATLTYTPNTTVEIADEAIAQKVMKLMDALDDLDDVSETYTNFEIA